MAGIRKLLISILEIALLGSLVIGLAALFSRVSRWATLPQELETVISIDPLTADQPYPVPVNTETLPDWLTQPMETELPTPTNIPFPTPFPTPLVTPVPLAQPPIIPSVIGAAPEVFTVVVRDGNTLRSVNSRDGSEVLLLDVSAISPLYLNNEGSWGAASPDGTKLALVLKTQSEPWSKGHPLPKWSLHLFDINTGQLQLLVENGVEPAWSPDGIWIAYRDQNSGLSIVNALSWEIRQIYQADQHNGHYVDGLDWAPTSDRLVFVDKVFRETSAIISINIYGNEPIKELEPEAYYRQSDPQWSPVGDRVVYVKLSSVASKGIGEPYYSLWITDSDGNEQEELTRDLSVMGKPMWSPDGEWVALYGSLLFEEQEPLTELWLINVNSHELKRLTSNEFSKTNESVPQWSPAGTLIVFLSEREQLKTLSLIDGIETRIASTRNNFIILP